MSTRRRQRSSGCSFENHGGRLRLRYRIPGRGQHARATGLRDTPGNRQRLERLRLLVGAVIRAGQDPTPVLDEHFAEHIGPAPLPRVTSVPPPNSVTLTEYYERWIGEQIALVRRAQARDYERHLRGYVLPVLGSLPIIALTAADVRGLQLELLTRGRPRVPDAPPPRRGTPSRHRPLAVKTVRNILSGSLRAMLRQARKDGYLTRDRLADVMDLDWPQAAPPQPEPFTADERGRVLAWFGTHAFRVPAGPGSPRYVLRTHLAYYAYLHLLLWSGMRPSEAAGLQWQDIDLERGRAEVRRSRHLWTYGEPKTASARRTVQLFPETVRLLRVLVPLRVEPTMPVFTHTRGGPIEPNSLLPHWYAAQRASGIRVRGLYSTKDTFVTTALEAGVTIAWLETQTGVNYLTLRRHYGRWMPSDAGRELDRFATLDPGLFAATSTAFVTGNKPDREQRRESVVKPRLSRCEREDLNPHGVATTGS
jgi:integrase